ncbi:hypothetical protein [Protaetiibacter mangrovi]|uniref:DUF4259 domain-containing protein n=1 Tax=Protaetiibacter mangrovi TaxID=2970926 RepID=A0ABT1ZI78_9MICO|nr:hypothetical protein [Protaetiibacter mangrovi]MCS0500430.1 hypothetical protein [Protaetiibacter mangrovi]TPX04163.1 hypothetical protein FJ656_13315 [Schumannella luteola]
MWTPDDFPGADHVPWQLLIRARFVREIDAVVASQVVRALGAVIPAKAAVELSHAATRAVAAAPEERIGAEGSVRAMSAYADFDDWCGTRWPHWPFPVPPRRIDELVDPIAVAVLGRARDFVAAAGSPELQKGLGSALEELSDTLGR